MLVTNFQYLVPRFNNFVNSALKDFLIKVSRSEIEYEKFVGQFMWEKDSECSS